MKTLPLYRPWFKGVQTEEPKERNSDCTSCDFHKKATTVCMSASGDPGGAMIVYPNPTHETDRSGRWVQEGFAGHLQQIVERNFDGPVRYTFGVSCSGTPIEVDNIDACRGYLAGEIDRSLPTRIVAVGDVSVRAIFGQYVSTTNVRRGWAYLNRGGRWIPVFMVLHPQIAMHNRFASRWYEQDLAWALTVEPPPMPKGEVRVLESREEVLQYLESIDSNQPTFPDVEHSGKLWDAKFGFLCVGLCQDPEHPVVIPRDVLSSCSAEFGQFISDPRYPKVNQNIKHDRHALYRHGGYDLAGIDGDTMLEAKIRESEAPAALASLAWHVGMGGYKKLVQDQADDDEDGKDFAKLDPDTLHWYCVMHGTPVLLPDGKWVTIESLVRRRYSGEVLSVSDDGVVEPAKVVGWWKNRVANQKWLRLRVDAGASSPRGLILTPDHKLLTNKGWVESEFVQRGDFVATHEQKLTDQQMRAILGSVLGDGWLVCSPTVRDRKITKASKVAFVCGHAEHTGLAQRKMESLPPNLLKVGPARPGGVVEINGRRGFRSPTLKFSTRMMRQLRDLVDLVYDEKGKRRIKITALYNLGAEGLAWWFLDDGGKQKPSKTRNVGDTLCLATQGFPREDVILASQWFEKTFGGKAWVTKVGSLRFSHYASVKIGNFIAPYVPPEFRYKLPSVALPNWVGAFKSFVGTYYAKVIASEEYKPRKETKSQRLIAETRFCLSVERNHNFITPNGVVSNCGLDVSTTARVHAWQRPKMGRLMPAWDHLYGPAVEALGWVERWGIKLSEQNVREYDRWLTERIDKTLIDLRSIEGVWQGFKPNSNVDKQKLLFDVLGAERRREWKTKTGYSVKEEVLDILSEYDKLADEEKVESVLKGSIARAARVLLDFSKYSKQKSSYGLGLLDYVGYDGRVHTNFKLIRSGRLSSSDPNMQSITSSNKEEGQWSRGCFVSEPGYILLESDYSQNELRIGAMLSGDEVMAAAFESGYDFHRMTAAEAFGIKPDDVTGDQRDIGKRLNFGLVFGLSEFGLAKQAGISVEKARDLIDGLLGKYKKFSAWRRKVVADAHNTGESFVTWNKWVHRRNLWQIGETGRGREVEGKIKHWANVAMNDPIQNVANCFPLASLVETVRWILDEDFPARLVLTVHDSLVLEVREDRLQEAAARQKEIMLSFHTGCVKLKVDQKAGDNWGHMTKI